jgi:hypothetical protein
MGVQQTSAEAYHLIRNLGSRQRDVYTAIDINGPVCNLHIAKILGKPINQITPRTNELVQMGLVYEAYKETIEETGRKSIFW